MKRFSKSLIATFTVSNNAPYEGNLSVIILKNLIDNRKNKVEDIAQKLYVFSA